MIRQYIAREQKCLGGRALQGVGLSMATKVMSVVGGLWGGGRAALGDGLPAPLWPIHSPGDLLTSFCASSFKCQIMSNICHFSTHLAIEFSSCLLPVFCLNIKVKKIKNPHIH